MEEAEEDLAGDADGPCAAEGGGARWPPSPAAPSVGVDPLGSCWNMRTLG